MHFIYYLFIYLVDTAFVLKTTPLLYPGLF